MISLDPAQLRDYSALAVIEYSSDNTYRLIDLNRKQKLPYTEIVAWAKKVYLNPKFQPNPIFILDIGGVGRAIGDMLIAAGIKFIGVQSTGGDVGRREGTTYYGPKTHIIGKFLGAWDAGRILMPSNSTFYNPFKKELRAFRGSMTSQNRAKFEAEQGEHDDLVMAVAQAVYWCEIRDKPQRAVFYKLPADQRIKPAYRIPGTAIPRPLGGGRFGGFGTGSGSIVDKTGRSFKTKSKSTDFSKKTSTEGKT